MNQAMIKENLKEINGQREEIEFINAAEKKEA